MNGGVQAYASPRKVLVAAVGNPDRADDGIAALVATKLADRLPPGATLVVLSGDIASVIDKWAGFDAVVCIDAAALMETPGRVHRIDARVDELRNGSFASTHGFGLAEAIALARTLGSLPETVIIYAIECARFDHGASMTPEVAAAASEVADRVVAEVGYEAARAVAHS